mgnify:CR=1 FL=1|tara:strand:+ start:6941 stop:7942 length:1002 start_codon:yes stop_codon:yes gene_type:complete
MPIVNVFYDSLSFATADTVWNDAALTIPAVDGWYSAGDIYRYATGGVLGPVQDCDDCAPPAVPCGTAIAATGEQGRYSLSFDVGTDIGAIVIKFYPANIPDKCTWTFDGVSASEYSCLTYGYLQGIIGNITNGGECGLYVPPGGVYTQPITNALGSNGATYSAPGAPLSYNWEYNGTDFINTSVPVVMGPYLSAALGGVTLTAGNPGWCYMIVPKPNATPSTVNLVIDGPCGDTGWQLEMYCPRVLNRFDVGDKDGICGTYSTFIYSCAVVDAAGADGTSSVLGLYDWVFADANGDIPFPSGTYPTLIAGVESCITISTDGIITAITTCSGNC